MVILGSEAALKAAPTSSLDNWCNRKQLTMSSENEYPQTIVTAKLGNKADTQRPK